MAITKREFILATCFLSGAASIISFVSLGTQYWVTAKGKWVDDPTLSKLNEIRYGLFAGTLRVYDPFPWVYELQMTCLLDKNVCAFLCGNDESARQSELQDLYDGKNPEFDRSCPKITSLYDERGDGGPFPRATKGSDLDFINAGVWVTTILFLCLSGLMGIVAAGIAVWNTASNPIQLYLSVFGLYIYNGIAFFCVLLVLLLWGIMFAQTTIHNVGILYTLEGTISSDERAELGYSYWINMASLFLYCTSIALLYLRQYLIAKEPKVDVHMEDNADPGLYLY